MNRDDDAVDPRLVVGEGYDRIGERYLEWSTNECVDDVRGVYTAELLDNLPRGARVLDLGCGGGGPTTQQLAERFDLTGVDISRRQIELAKQNVQGATFLQGDMTKIGFPVSSFAGVAAFYALTHLPQGELPRLLKRISLWLSPGGWFVASMSNGPLPGVIEQDWLGAPMYFSGYSPGENRQFVERAGLRVSSAEPGTLFENGRPVTFFWVVARKPEPTR